MVVAGGQQPRDLLCKVRAGIARSHSSAFVSCCFAATRMRSTSRSISRVEIRLLGKRLNRIV